MTTSNDYKDRATFVFKGITWKYNKHYGEWQPSKNYSEYPTIFSSESPSNGWIADGVFGKTPEQALKTWTRNYIKTVASNHTRLSKQVRDAAVILRKLRSKSWI